LDRVIEVIDVDPESIFYPGKWLKWVK
jgi:hypothetical protein